MINIKMDKLLLLLFLSSNKLSNFNIYYIILYNSIKIDGMFLTLSKI